MIEQPQIIQDIIIYGLYQLPCGGAIIKQPRHVIKFLQHEYGRDELCQQCMQLVCGDMPSHLSEVKLVAEGVVYHLADDALLDELLAQRKDSSLDPLIASICKRLGHPVPDNIPPVSDHYESTLFGEECDPLPTIHVIILLLVLLANIALILFIIYWLIRSIISWIM